MVEYSNRCVSCYACVDICPKNCIKIDRYGQISVDKEHCIGCNLCTGKCQKEKSTVLNIPKKVYVATRDRNDKLLMSSSGGVASALMERVIDRGGIVYSARYRDMMPVIERLDRKEDIQYFQRSKYCFSDMRNCYEQCTRDLKLGKEVLIIALPCQIEALRLYYGNKYEKLYLVDLLCHGAPASWLFAEHIKYLEKKYKSEVVNYEFRKKLDANYGLYAYEISFASGRKKKGPMGLDVYYKMFFHGKTFRECCYECKFAKTERGGDMSLGDFWKISEENNSYDTYKGASSVLVNTNKGESLLELISSELRYSDASLECLKRSTHAITHPVDVSNRIDVEKIVQNGYSKWARKQGRSVRVLLRRVKYYFWGKFDKVKIR